MSTGNKEILLVVRALANEKGVDESLIFEAVEAALASVTARRYTEEALIRVAIDRDTGDYEAFRCWEVAELAEDGELELPDEQLTLEQASEFGEGLEIGSIVEEAVEPAEFGRIAAQQAKQIITQKVREAERDKIADQYRERIGELLIGTVKRVTRDFIVLDMGNNAEALMSRDEMMPRDIFRLNDRARVYLYAISEDRRGPQLMVSRIHPQLLVELFKVEVPEIADEMIEIVAASRDPGARAKIAVKTNDGRIDPIGACVGMRGARVQAVSNELGGERVDIILWDGNPAQFVINAMAPAEVASIMVDEETHSIDVMVAEDQLSQAIGRGGQNVRLASDLTGWTLNVMTPDQATEKQAEQSSGLKQVFIDNLGVDDDFAEVLVQEGFTNLEEVAYVPQEELLEIDGFDEALVQELQNRASDVLLTQEIATQTALSEAAPAEDLLALEGMTTDMAIKLAQAEVVTLDDLAELSIDELQEIVELDEVKAGELIMSARQHWFADEATSTEK